MKTHTTTTTVTTIRPQPRRLARLAVGVLAGALSLALLSSRSEAGWAMNGLRVTNGLNAFNGLKVHNGLSAINGLKVHNGLKAHNGLSAINGMKVHNGFRAHNGMTVVSKTPARRLVRVWIMNGIDPRAPLAATTAKARS